MPNLVFLSYSREQFYFAESLTLALQAAGVDVWFDIQRLTPGSNWQAGIEQGLAECNHLILVASRAALASPYVRHEWETVLQEGHRVDVALFEGVRLPAELEANASSIIDMRADFDGGVARLVNNLESGLRQRDPVPRPDPLGIPTVVPPEVRQTANLLAVNALAIMLLGSFLTDFNFWSFELVEAFFRDDTVWFFVFVTFTLGALLLVTRWRFLRRAIGYDSISLAFHLIAVAQMFVGVIAALYILITPDWETRLLALIVITLAGALIFYSRRVTNVYFNTQALLRWMPRGAAISPQRSTLRLRGGKRPSSVSKGEGVRFRLHFHPGDQRLATRVGEIMRKHGHIETADADLNLAIITRKTDPAEIGRLVAKIGSLLPIIAENIDFDKYRVIHPFQVVDYRQHNRSVIEALALYLRDPARGASIYGVNVTPLRFDQALRPSLNTWVDELQESTPIVRHIGFWGGRAVIAGMVGVIVISFFNTIASPAPPRPPTPTPQPTISFSEAVATNDAVFGRVQTNLFGTVQGTFDTLHYTLGTHWQTAEGEPTDPDLQSVLADYNTLAVPVWSAVRTDSAFSSESLVKLLALRFAGGERAFDYIAQQANEAPISLTMNDDVLTGHYVRSFIREMGGELTLPYIFAVESAATSYAIHASHEDVDILSQMPPLEILDFVQPLSIEP